MSRLPGRARRAAGRILLIAAALEVASAAAPSYAQHWWEVPTPPPAADSTPEATLVPPSPTAEAVAIPAPTLLSTPAPTATQAAPTATQEPSPTATPEGPRCSIAVLEQPPTEAFELIAIVEVRPQGFDNPEASLQAAEQQGCTLGGDALVILHREEQRWRSMDSPPGPLGVIPNPAIRGAVIRYRQR